MRMLFHIEQKRLMPRGKRYSSVRMFFFFICSNHLNNACVTPRANLHYNIFSLYFNPCHLLALRNVNRGFIQLLSDKLCASEGRESAGFCSELGLNLCLFPGAVFRKLPRVGPSGPLIEMF